MSLQRGKTVQKNHYRESGCIPSNEYPCLSQKGCLSHCTASSKIPARGQRDRLKEAWRGVRGVARVISTREISWEGKGLGIFRVGFGKEEGHFREGTPDAGFRNEKLHQRHPGRGDAKNLFSTDPRSLQKPHEVETTPFNKQGT